MASCIVSLAVRITGNPFLSTDEGSNQHSEASFAACSRARRRGSGNQRRLVKSCSGTSSLGGNPVMTHQELVDTQVDDLRDKLPHLLRQNPRAVAFLQVVSERAHSIVEAAAVVGEEEAVYAKQRIGEALMAFGRETSLRLV